MNPRKYLAILLLPLLFTACQKKTENPLKELEDKDIHFLSLHLYPSTIRMVNIANDSSFYKATKNVKSAHYLQINLDSPEKTAIYEDWKNEQDLSEWDELLSARMNGSMVSIYTPANKEEYYFATVKSEDIASLVWLEGEIDLKQVTNLMKTGINLGPVTDFLDDKKESEERREKMRSMRSQMEEEERIKKAQKEQDSLESK